MRQRRTSSAWQQQVAPEEIRSIKEQTMQTLKIGGREFNSQETFVRGGRRCGTPQLNDFQKERVRAHMRVARANGMDAAAITTITIPVHYHVIHDGGIGDVSDADLTAQLDVMNNCYSAHGITFTQASVDRTDNGVWHRMTMGSPAERKAKKKLGREQDKALNFYTAGIGAGLLGWATFPSDFAGDPDRDGVVVLFSSLPNGASAPYNLGLTAVHEVGHWLGLYHTFEGGCVPPGDEVSDTPFEASPNFGAANPTRDTCPNDAGKDPTTNFMDYTDDIDMTQFSAGQITRIKEQVGLYRPALLGSAAKATDTAGIDFETGDF
jgi:pregnancy-associated plasma protein-A